MAKRRANGEGTIRKRADGRWEGRYYDSQNGKTCSIYATTQKAVREKLNAKIREIQINQGLQQIDLTVDEWFQIWEERYLNNVKPLTLSAYDCKYRNHIKPYIGDELLANLNIECIQMLYNKLYEGTETKKGIAPKTLKEVHGILHKALEQARKNKYISSNPTEGCVLPKIIKKEMHPLTDDKIKIFLEKIKGHKYENVFILTLFTGMRESEVLGLTWENIDFKNGTITISKQLQKSKGAGGQYYLGPPKNNKPRIIVPANYVLDVLQCQREEQQKMKNAMGSKWTGDSLSDSFVFTNEFGRHLAHYTVYKKYKGIVKEMGMGESRFHDLRHSYAVLALQNGDDVKTVQETLGHHTAAFTLDVYGHVSKKMKRDSAERMENFISSMDIKK